MEMKAMLDNLTDAGCGKRETEIVEKLYENGQKDELIRFFKKCRCTLVDEMHESQRKVDRMDYLIVRNDEQTTTSSGDIMLYSGNQIVVFYGSNSWAYTRLGHIDLSQQEMTNLLSNGDITITITED